MDKSGRVSTVKTTKYSVKNTIIERKVFFYLANTTLTVISPDGNGNAALYQSVCALRKSK